MYKDYRNISGGREERESEHVPLIRVSEILKWRKMPGITSKTEKYYCAGVTLELNVDQIPASDKSFGKGCHGSEI